jgi:hypothetical protein
MAGLLLLNIKLYPFSGALKQQNRLPAVFLRSEI